MRIRKFKKIPNSAFGRRTATKCLAKVGVRQRRNPHADVLQIRINVCQNSQTVENAG
jgi:hypothetical protein